MPTYEYVCTECSQPLEVVQSIHDPALTECPACGGRLRKVFGNVGVVFKGSGFYRTDSRGKSSAATPTTQKAASPSAGSTSDGGSGSGSSSGSGPAATPASSGSGSGAASTSSPSSAASASS
jgi:putative FmdB family regulatory protein